MLFNYFNTNNNQHFKLAIGYDFLEQNVFIGAYKHRLFGENFFILNIAKTIFPSIYIEKDVSLLSSQMIIEKSKQWGAFYASGFSFQNITDGKKHYTFLINLKQDIEDLYKNLDRSIKKNLNYSKNLALSFRKVQTLNDFQEYSKLLINFRKNNNLRADTRRILEKQWSTLHKDNIKESNYEVFLCYDKDQNILSGMGTIINWQEKQFIEVSIARSKVSREQGLPDGDFLKWSIINWAKTQGLESYNLAGVIPNAPIGSKEYNIFKYKEKWGGVLTPYYFYEEYFQKNRWYYRFCLDILRFAKRITT